MKKSWTFYIGTALGAFVLILAFIELKLRSKAKKYINACSEAFGKLDKTQEDSIYQIVKAFQKYGDGDLNKLAYILATTRHESNFRPIEERRAKPNQTDIYNLQNRYWPSGFYGRGFVQLTWQRNYQKMSDFLGVDLVANPALALNPKYAAQILVYGMMNGSFTRKKLADYINDQSQDYYNARKTVNGTDRAALIKSYTLLILNKL